MTHGNEYVIVYISQTGVGEKNKETDLLPQTFHFVGYYLLTVPVWLIGVPPSWKFTCKFYPPTSFPPTFLPATDIYGEYQPFITYARPT